MIPKKNLFSGGLGKTRKPGGAPFMTIPHTRTVGPPNYVLEDTAISGKYLCCSLNGLLWMYKVKTTEDELLYVVALFWDKEAGCLRLPPDGISRVFLGSSNMNVQDNEPPNTPVARGIDWILTARFVFQSIPEPPYIAFANTMTHAGIITDMHAPKGLCFHYSLFRGFMINNFHIQGNRIGGGIDPFTHNYFGMDAPSAGNGRGYFSFGTGGLSLYPLHAQQGPSGYIPTREMESCYSTLQAVGDWNIVEDFLVRRPQNPLPPKVDKRVFRQAVPLMPLEFNWYIDLSASSGTDIVSYPTFGTGYSATRRGVQLAAFQNALWGRGLSYIGRAFILPQIVGPDGEFEGGWLLITNSHNCIGPYNQFYNSNLDETVLWMSLGCALLKDNKHSPESQLAGFLSEKESPMQGPICRTPKRGDILLPDDPEGGLHGQWKQPRQNDTGGVTIDQSSGLALAVGEKGVSFFSGDTEKKNIRTDDDYECCGLWAWFSPGGHFESVDVDAVVSSFDDGLLVTNIDNFFARMQFPKCVLPLSWGSFEKKDANGNISGRVRLSIREEAVVIQDPNTGEESDGVRLGVYEHPIPADTTQPPVSIPWENVFRSPVSLRMLRHEEANDVARDFKLKFFPALPCVPVLIRSYDDSTINFVWVNPDTAEFVPAEVRLELEPGESVNRFPAPGPQGVLGVEIIGGGNGSRFVAIDDVPSWLSDNDAWRLVDFPNGYIEQQTLDRVPGFCLRPYIAMRPDIRTFESSDWDLSWHPGFASYCFLHGFETSSRMDMAWRHPSFSNYQPNYVAGVVQDLPASMVEMDLRQVVHFGAAGTPNYLGQTKYRKNFALWENKAGEMIPMRTGADGGRWSANRLFFMRADLDNEVFDFDAEMRRSRHFKQGAGGGG